MPRFERDDLETHLGDQRAGQEPTATQSTDLGAQGAIPNVQESQPSERNRWYRLNRDSDKDKKAKSEKADDLDYVEEASDDLVWGKLGEGAPNYKNVGWRYSRGSTLGYIHEQTPDFRIKSACFLINLQIGIGVLALPNTLHALGLVPGVILIIASGIITTWADTVIGMFKRAHPEVYSIADVGAIMAGPWGKEIFGGMYWLFCVLVGAGQVLAFSTAMNAVTLHGTCTVVFVMIGAGLGIVIGLYRTLDKISWTMWVALSSLMVALITAAAATGVQDRPADVMPGEPFTVDVRMFNNPGFFPGVQAGTNILLAFTGGPAFYNVLSEMKNTRDFNKSVYLCQTWVTTTYVVIAAVMYSFVGQHIASPALGSAGPLMKRVCYGIVLPGLIIGAVLYVHIPAKYVFVRALRNTRHLTESTWQHWTVWTGSVVTTGVLVFIFSLAIPVFDDLLTLISALFGTPLAVTIPAVMWIWETRRARPASDRGIKWWIGVTACLLLIAVSAFIAIAGTVSAVVSLNNAVQTGDAQPFSCADNSNSV